MGILASRYPRLVSSTANCAIPWISSMTSPSAVVYATDTRCTTMSSRLDVDVAYSVTVVVSVDSVPTTLSSVSPSSLAASALYDRYVRRVMLFSSAGVNRIIKGRPGTCTVPENPMEVRTHTDEPVGSSDPRSLGEDISSRVTSNTHRLLVHSFGTMRTSSSRVYSCSPSSRWSWTYLHSTLPSGQTGDRSARSIRLGSSYNARCPGMVGAPAPTIANACTRATANAIANAT
jgi:hypothetical protein